MSRIGDIAERVMAGAKKADYTPRYIINTNKYRVYSTRWSHTHAEWRTNQYGRPTPQNIKEYVKRYNDSLEADGVNSHLGRESAIYGAEIVDQTTGETVAEWSDKSIIHFYKSKPMFEVAGAERKAAAAKDLADIKELLVEMHEKQEEVAKKKEEYLRETNKLWYEATKGVEEGTAALIKEIQKELVLYFKGNGMGVRKSDASGGLVEVFIGSDDGTGERYQSKVSALIQLTFEHREKAKGMFRNENLDETVNFDLSDKDTVAALMKEVKKADKKGFWKMDAFSGGVGTTSWRK